MRVLRTSCPCYVSQLNVEAPTSLNVSWASVLSATRRRRECGSRPPAEGGRVFPLPLPLLPLEYLGSVVGRRGSRQAASLLLNPGTHAQENKKKQKKTKTKTRKRRHTHARACARLGLSLPLKDDGPDQKMYPGFREPDDQMDVWAGPGLGRGGALLSNARVSSQGSRVAERTFGKKRICKELRGLI